MKNKWQNFLVWLGYLSPCCKAKVSDVDGWNQTYCSNCEKRLS